MTPSSATPRKRRINGAATFAIVVGIVVALYSGHRALAEKPAPAIALTTLTGEKVTNDSLKGKVTLVNFWATSCSTCMHEMPEMVKTYDQFKGQGLEFVAVAMNYDPPNYVTTYTQSRQLPFKVALDLDGKEAERFDAQMTPTTFVIDKQGKIVRRYLGEPNFAELRDLLKQQLAA